MSTDLEPRHFSSPLAIFFVLNSEEKHISHISKNIFIKMGEYFLWKGLWRMLLISAIGWLPGYSDRIFFFSNCTNNLVPPKAKHRNLRTFLYDVKQCD